MMKQIEQLSFFILLFLTAYSVSAIGIEPYKYNNYSRNKKYLVTIYPPNENSNVKSKITVSSKNGTKWQKFWEVTAVNKIQPASAYITNDGSSVLTLSNWYGNDDGKDALVIYKKGIIFKQFSVDDILDGHFEPQFHTTDGAEWLYNSFTVFDGESEFAIWVDYVRRWVVVNIKTGEIVPPSEQQRKKFENEVREESYKSIKSGKWVSYTLYRSLALFIKPEDKTIFQKLLTNPYSNLSCGYSDTFSDGPGAISYFRSNKYRELAEMALNALENNKSDAVYNFKQENYKRLGSLKITASFNAPIREQDGVIVLWLQEVKNGDLIELNTAPVDCIGIELKFAFPYKLSKTNRSINWPLQIRMHGIKPGKYRLFGYWDKAIKDLDSIEENYWQRVVSPSITEPPEVEIKKGKTTEIKVYFRQKAD